jgi:hypothetical protein
MTAAEPTEAPYQITANGHVVAGRITASSPEQAVDRYCAYCLRVGSVAELRELCEADPRLVARVNWELRSAAGPAATPLQDACREALGRMRTGAVRYESVPRLARLVLENRRLVESHTDGLLSLTHTGRGYAADPQEFDI